MNNNNSPNATVQLALERFKELLTPAQYNKLVQTLSDDLKPSLRINLLKQDASEFSLQLRKRYGWHMQQVPFCASGFNLSHAAENLSKTIEHTLGEYYIQESASMLPVEMFDLSSLPAPLILDMAASPGGKTTHLVDRTSDKGLVIANDASSRRMAALRIVLAKWGAINQATTCLHGEFFGEHLTEQFDAVLLDAPCSMQNLYDSPSHPLREISAGEQQGLSNRQYLLLRSALQTVKVGGQVIYSTCTLSPEEDEQVVQRILEEFGSQVMLDDINSTLPKPAPALPQDGIHKFAPEMKNAIRLWPHIYGTTGFFCARFSKQDSLGVPASEDPVRANPKFDRSHLLSDKQQGEVCRWMKDSYGFDLYAVMQEQQDQLFEGENSILLVPQRLFQECCDLPITSVGLNAFKHVPSGYQISHDLAARFGNRFTEGVLTLDTEQCTQYLAHRDIMGYAVPAELIGQTLLVKNEHGQVLGRVKALKDRLKNLLPARLY